jgi:ribA/ribD-fused uncharacterized protein
LAASPSRTTSSSSSARTTSPSPRSTQAQSRSIAHSQTSPLARSTQAPSRSIPSSSSTPPSRSIFASPSRRINPSPIITLGEFKTIINDGTKIDDNTKGLYNNAIQNREAPEFCFFWHTYEQNKIGTELYPKTQDPEDENQCFSNWYPSLFTIKGITFKTAEHYIMYHKCLICSGSIAEAQAILNANTPNGAKYLAGEVYKIATEENRKKWHREKKSISYQGLFEKFNQNAVLKQLLLATSNAIMVEASPCDKAWGVGMDKNHPKITDPSQWEGDNLLGILLMKVRDNLN